MMNWLPLDNVLVRFVDDPALYHQRIVLRCSRKDKVHVVTPDREVQETELKDPALTQHAARRQAAKAEILRQTRLAAEERRHLLRRGDDDKGDDKGGGKGRKGKEDKSAP